MTKQVVIQLTENELRERYTAAVTDRARVTNIATILKDESFIHDLKEDFLGAGGRDESIPIKIEVK